MCFTSWTSHTEHSLLTGLKIKYLWEKALHFKVKNCFTNWAIAEMILNVLTYWSPEVNSKINRQLPCIVKMNPQKLPVALTGLSVCWLEPGTGHGSPIKLHQLSLNSTLWWTVLTVTVSSITDLSIFFSCKGRIRN